MKPFALTLLLAAFVLVPSAHAFAKEADMPTRDLMLGSRGAEVTWLQEHLLSENVGPAAYALARTGATGYFGSMTQAALVEYQAKHGITPARGYFGAKTRAVIMGNSALHVPTFSGPIESIDTGCYADGICSVMIGGKEVIVMAGFRPVLPPVGRLIGVESFGDLEKHIGAHARVYAATTTEGGADYTLYGSTKYYVEVLKYVPEDGSITVRGTLGCLPPKETDKPVIAMCAFGLKAEDGTYYALRSENVDVTRFMSDTIKVEVKGTFKEGQTPPWKNVGTINVASVTEVK